MNNMNNIKYIVMDVDGTLTDGKIYMGEEGESFKTFSIKDGYGIKNIAINRKIEPVIITGRTSIMLENRCRELGINKLYQGITDKNVVLKDVTTNYDEVAYIGDDLNDIECMKAVSAAGGIVGCPKNAVEDVRKIADFVSTKDGGDGAVREFIEWIVKNNGKSQKNQKTSDINKKKCRKISYKGSFVFLVSCLVLMIGSYVISKASGKAQDKEFILIYIILFLLIIFSLLKCFMIKSTNKYLKNLPYAFDYEDEVKKYKNVGLKSHEFKNYTEWKEHIELQYTEKKDNDNFKHYLIKLLRYRNSYEKLFSSLLIPSVLAIVSCMNTAYSSCFDAEILYLQVIVEVGVAVVYLSYISLNIQDEINFLNDYMDILFNK